MEILAVIAIVLAIVALGVGGYAMVAMNGARQKAADADVRSDEAARLAERARGRAATAVREAAMATEQVHRLERLLAEAGVPGARKDGGRAEAEAGAAKRGRRGSEPAEFDPQGMSEGASSAVPAETRGSRRSSGKKAAEQAVPARRAFPSQPAADASARTDGPASSRTAARSASAAPPEREASPYAQPAGSPAAARATESSAPVSDPWAPSEGEHPADPAQGAGRASISPNSVTEETASTEPDPAETESAAEAASAPRRTHRGQSPASAAEAPEGTRAAAPVASPVAAVPAAPRREDPSDESPSDSVPWNASFDPQLRLLNLTNSSPGTVTGVTLRAREGRLTESATAAAVAAEETVGMYVAHEFAILIRARRKVRGSIEWTDASGATRQADLEGLEVTLV